MGSWPFIGFFVAAMALWALLNSVVLRREAWDPYPYITNSAAKAEIDRLIELCEHQAKMMVELHALVEQLPVGKA